MASTYLYRQVSSSETNKKKVTISLWFKKSVNGVEETLISGFMTNDNRWKIRFKSDDTLDAEFGYGGSWYSLRTNRKFRDTSGWYHCVVAYDTTQGTASERAKMYINGIQETSFQTEAYPPQNYGIYVVENTAQVGIGRAYYGSGYQTNTNWSGLMSHIHVTDGYTYTASSFGSTDSTTGEWKIKTEPSVSYGTNGFFILKDGNSATDASPNTNNFTIGVGAGGGLSKTEDNPSNVFATLNPLSTLSTLTYAYGNNQITGVNSNVWKTTFSTLGMNYGSSGKYYYEIKVATLNSQAGIGVWGEPLPQTVTTNFFPNHHPFGFVYKEDGSVSDDSQTFYTGSSFTSGDIIQCALDIDNSKIYFGKGGVWQNSGDPTSGATGTGAVPLEDNGGGAYFFFGTSYGTDVIQTNFGNGYFANNPVSSAGTNASGNGIFEYDVPTGYTALSTKGLNL